MNAVICERPPFGVVVLFSEFVPDGTDFWEGPDPETGNDKIPHFGVVEGKEDLEILQQVRRLLIYVTRHGGTDTLVVLVHKNIESYVQNVGHFLAVLNGSFRGRVIAMIETPEEPEGLRRLVPPDVTLIRKGELEMALMRGED